LRPAVLDGGGTPRSTGVPPVPRLRAGTDDQNILDIAAQSSAQRRNGHASSLRSCPPGRGR